MRTPGPPGVCQLVMRPGLGVNLKASSALMRHSMECPLICTSRWRRVNFSPAAIRICCCTKRSEEHTSELQSLMRISYAVFCLKKKNTIIKQETHIKY